MSHTMPDRMPEYMSWNVIGGIAWSKIYLFIFLYLLIYFYICLYTFISFFWRKNVFYDFKCFFFDFWTNKTILYLTPCDLQHYLVLLIICYHLLLFCGYWCLYWYITAPHCLGSLARVIWNKGASTGYVWTTGMPETFVRTTSMRKMMTNHQNLEYSAQCRCSAKPPRSCVGFRLL